MTIVSDLKKKILMYLLSEKKGHNTLTFFLTYCPKIN